MVLSDAKIKKLQEISKGRHAGDIPEVKFDSYYAKKKRKRQLLYGIFKPRKTYTYKIKKRKVKRKVAPAPVIKMLKQIIQPIAEVIVIPIKPKPVVKNPPYQFSYRPDSIEDKLYAAQK